MTVENLNISVKTNADKAADKLDKLSAALKGIKEAADGVVLEGGVVAVGKAATQSKKEVEALSGELQNTIRNASKYQTLVAKAEIARDKMNEAFKNGDEDAAWSAREREINAVAQAAKELEREQAAAAKNQPQEVTPVPIDLQGIIQPANEVDILRNKLDGLKAALQEAFESGNTEKAWALQSQILSTAKSLDKAEEAARKAASGIEEVGKAANKTDKPLGNFLSSLKRIAFYRIIRGIIKSITQAFTEGLEKAYLFSAGIQDAMGHRFAAAMDSLKSSTNAMKGQLGSAFISLLAAIEPILNRIIDLVIRVADAISQLFAAFTGTTYLKAEKTTAKFVDNMKSGGRAAKEWKNQLLGFDEINRLNAPSNGGGGGGTNPLAGYEFNDSPLEDWAMKIHDNLALIETVASGFALGLGLILTLSGANIPLGLGLIALGAIGLIHAATENWDLVSSNVAAKLHNIMVVAGISMLGIGLVLALSGANIPLGLGLIAAGAASLVTAAAIRWGLDGEVGAELTKITQVASLGMFAVGLIMALTGNLPLGLGIMGASLFAYATTINWNAMLDGMKETWRGITNWYHEKVEKYFTKEWWQEQIDLIMPDWGKIFRGLSDWCISAHNWIQDVLTGIGLVNGGGENVYTWAGAIERPRAYASGGFPEEGELFIARESGAELVGSMGGRAAVANNDQIVEGIRQGVYDAVVAANGNGSGDVSVRVYLDSREIKAGQQRLNRAWGV